MNYTKQFLKLLDLQVNEEFTLLEKEKDYIYRINNDCVLQVKHINKNNDWTQSCFWIEDIISGKYKITKLKEPKTELERLAIEYAKACKMKWLAKDGFGDIIAFPKKPVRGTKLWFKDAPSDKAIEIGIPLSFLKWEDEPYYIGD